MNLGFPRHTFAFFAFVAFLLPTFFGAQQLSAQQQVAFDHDRFAGPLLPVEIIEEPAPDLVAWRSIEEGEEEAKATGRLVFYFFTADWCSPCTSMKDHMFSDERIADLIHANYVPIEVKDRRVEEGKNALDVDQVQMRFLVEAFPTLVVGRPYNGHGVTEAGLVNEQGLVTFLRRGPGEIHRLEGGSR